MFTRNVKGDRPGNKGLRADGLAALAIRSFRDQKPRDSALHDDDCGPMLLGPTIVGCYAMP